MLSQSENSKELLQLSQMLSNPNLNNQFWHSLKETINMKKESQAIKKRIITAKRILTPIIHELMNDALKQIKNDNSEVNREFKGEEVDMSKEEDMLWHVQEDLVEGEEWVMRILREISRDFEEPFDELHGKFEKKDIVEQSSKDILFSSKLLTKLEDIYQHLGNIIIRLNEKCGKKRILEIDDSLNNLSNHRIKLETNHSSDSGGSIPRKIDQRSNFPCLVHSFCLSQRKVGYPSQKHNLSVRESRIQFTVKNASSAINFEDVERKAYSISRKLLHDVAVSYHALFEENKNNFGNKEIVIRCLEDLEKVRNYLEAIRDNRPCEKPTFCDLGPCKNDKCLESQPHLHSNLHSMPMVLKLNKHAEDNEHNSDLVISIPSLNKSSPDVHILLNTKDQHVEIKRSTDQNQRIQNQPKTPLRISRIPKPIDKKRIIDRERFVKRKPMKESLENKQDSQRKSANLLIFDPDDLSKSIIKMKEQKMKGADPGSVVSNACFTLARYEDLMILIIFCCIRGQHTTLDANTYIWLLLKGSCPFFHIMKLYVFIFNLHFSISMSAYMRKYLILMKSPKYYNCFMQKNSCRKGSMGLEFGYDRYLDSYMHHAGNLFSLMKTDTFIGKNILDEKNIYQQKKVSKKHQPWAATHYRVCFFECFKENKETRRSSTSSQRRWDYESLNSKYYSVPKDIKKNDEVVFQKVVEREIENEDHLVLSEVDSLEILREDHQEINLQISGVSLFSAELFRVGALETSSDKMCQKTEIKRKVSFRDEVDVSEAAVDEPADDENVDTQNYNIRPDAHFHGREHSHVEYTAERSFPPEDIPEDTEELSTRISDLLMTDSLMQIATDVPRCNTKRSKKASKKCAPKGLKLTDSARHALAELSKSFEKEQYGSISDSLDSDLERYFYDETGKPITEVYNSDGDLLFDCKNNIAHRPTSLLFDSGGIIHKNRYDDNGRRIKAVYDENGRLIGYLQDSSEKIKCVQADLEVVQYYDYKGKPIKNLYDFSGHEIKTIGKDFTSKIFNTNGRLQMDLYTKRGSRIEAVYDSDGRLLARVSYCHLEPLLRTEQVRVANMDDESSNKLFESESKSVKVQYEGINEQSKSPKRFFDREGNPLVGVYNKKGKPIKLTSSGEADELLPFLFDNKGKLQSKRYNSNGKELKEVFGEDGKAISEMSIAWLNDLIVSSKNSISKKKKKESIFKRIPRRRTKKEKQRDIEKLYDCNGRIITSIYDSKGKLLAVSLSGDAKMLLPILFDKGGKFIRKRYDSEKRKLRNVYGIDGKIISTISVTYLESIAENLECEKERRKSEDEDQIEECCENVNSGEETQEKTVENSESKKNIDHLERAPDRLSEYSSSGIACKLLPPLIDGDILFLKQRFDNQGGKLSGVYHNEGDILNNDLSTAIKIAASKVLVNTDLGKGYEGEETKIDMNGGRNLKTNEYRDNINQNFDESRVRNSAVEITDTPQNSISAALPKTLSKLENKSSISKGDKLLFPKEKHEEKATTSITVKQSMNQKLDNPEIPPKVADSIYRFYDKRGNVITELFDANGTVLIETRTGEADKLAKFLFDNNGFLKENVYNQRGRRIRRIFDQKKRTVNRISVPSIVSGITMPGKPNVKDEKLLGRVYDKYGFLVKELYDEKGRPIKITKNAEVLDLAPIIFDEKRFRRRINNKSGYEIGSIYDHKGNAIKLLPLSNKTKPSKRCKESWIFSKSGKPLRNFYDSNGTLIIALYNDYGKTLCRVKKGDDNVELMSNFFFDKHGHFLKGRFYNYRGDLIKHVYDSKGKIMRNIRRTESSKITHHTIGRNDKVDLTKNIEKNNKPDHRINFNSTSRQQRGYHGKSEVFSVENIKGISSSQSDIIVKLEVPASQRSTSAYSFREYSQRNYAIARSSCSSIPSLTEMPNKKFYEKTGKLLTEVYGSKTRLLGNSASGKSKDLAPYLFDTNGNFGSGRYNADRKPLKHIYDSDGKLVDKISKLDLGTTGKKPKKLKVINPNKDLIPSKNDLRAEKQEEIERFFEESGQIKNKWSKLRGSELRFHGNRDSNRNKTGREFGSDLETGSSEESFHKERLGLRNRVSALSNLKEKILTVIFDNQHRISRKISVQKIRKSAKIKKTKNKDDEGKSQSTNSHLYDKNLNVIKEIFDDRGRKINRVYNSKGRVICELYSISGILLKNNVLKSMFRKNVFTRKVYNSEGKKITKIFANNKLLRYVYDAEGTPAKVDSDLIYLVSKQSLPHEKLTQPPSHAQRDSNYISQDSTYPFPEEQNQNRPMQTTQLTEGRNYETEMEVAYNGYLRRRTEICTCEQCQKMGNNRIAQFGEELFDRLSRFAIPLTRCLPRYFLRRDTQDDEQPKGESDTDSLETFIEEARTQEIYEEARKQEISEEVRSQGISEGRDEEFYGSCSRVSLLESDDKIPISRKMVEKTLKKCVHLNSSTELVGRVSETVLQHFANLILREIEEKFYQKLNVLKCDRSHSLVFECHAEKAPPDSYQDA